MIPSVENSKRISILNQSEINELYEIPKFTDDERRWYFELHNSEQKLLKLPVSRKTKVDAILQLGYFKAKNQFFRYKYDEVKYDIYYILNQYFDEKQLARPIISRETKRKNQRRILSLLGFTYFNKSKNGGPLLAKARELSRLSANPVFIFRELIEFVYKEKMTTPGYTTLQEIISNALSLEQQRIKRIFDKELSQKEVQEVLQLLQKRDSFYAVTSLKKLPKNFRPKAVYQEIMHYQNYSSIYQTAKRVLPCLSISNNSIAYYASLVDHYTVRSLSRLKNNDQACLWLLCFIFSRTKRILDNLVMMFCYFANQFQAAVEEKSKELIIANAIEKDTQDDCIVKLLRIFIDTNIDDSVPFKTIKEKEAYAIAAPETINQISADLENKGRDYQAQFTWKAVSKVSSAYKPVLRALLKILPFECEQHKALKKAIDFLKSIFSNGKPISKVSFWDYPKLHIGKKIRKYIYDYNENTIYTDRYEYHCYQQIRKYVDAGSVFLNESIKYSSISSELIQEWPTNKKRVIRKINRPMLRQPLSDFIVDKARPLDKKITEVNEAIIEGNNPVVKIKIAKDGSSSWTLPYLKKESEINSPFYDHLLKVSIARILLFVNQQTQFLRQFSHIKPHYAKARLDEMAIYACLIANGTNLGVLKMAEICDLRLSSLQMTDKNYIRLSTLKAANDVISNAIAALSIFKYWNFREDILHASLDGQKFKTHRDTLLSRYSSKYFGFDKGVVAYTLIANHVPVNAMIIPANEHESRYLFDLVYNNTSEIQPDIFSTDTEGTNRLNFLLLHTIERIFAPRYRSLPTKAKSIVSYSDTKKFKNYLIKPRKRLNQKLVLEEEDNIKHILASLLVGETNQSNIIGKLGSNNYKSKTKQALWELNAVLMTDYLLDYIHNVLLRQTVQGSLCRGEAYHQLRRHIATINGRHFRGSSEMEIAVWNECARLLTNTIIYYNAVLLTNLLEHYKLSGQKEKYEFIKMLSPVAWVHINFHGQYSFMESEMIDIDHLLSQYKADDTFCIGKNAEIILAN
jgi:TnpA family transposase